VSVGLNVEEKWEETDQTKINSQRKKNMFEIRLHANADMWMKLSFFKEKKR
jgi:hypothetical protein